MFKKTRKEETFFLYGALNTINELIEDKADKNKVDLLGKALIDADTFCNGQRGAMSYQYPDCFFNHCVDTFVEYMNSCVELKDPQIKDVLGRFREFIETQIAILGDNSIYEAKAALGTINNDG